MCMYARLKGLKMLTVAPSTPSFRPDTHFPLPVASLSPFRNISDPSSTVSAHRAVGDGRTIHRACIGPVRLRLLARAR